MTEREATPEDVLSLADVAEEEPGNSVQRQFDAVDEPPASGGTVPPDDAQ